MAASTGYDYSIRQGLNAKGISNDRITYDPTKGVMVDGASFYKPEKVYNGSSFTSANNFNQAWNNYNKTQNQQKSVVGQAASTPTYGASSASSGYNYNPYANNSMINNNPYTSNADQIIQQLLNFGKNQGNFDPYSTSAYRAAEAQAQRAAQQNTRAAQEAYGSAGFGRSTALGERVAGINNDATEYLMTQVLPQIEAQEQARRQQEYNNTLSALQQLLGQQGRADNLVQQDFNNRVTEGQLTGNYLNPEATSIIDQIMSLKQQAETPGLANTRVKELSSQADVLRNRLTALGIDPALFGSNVNAQTAGQNRGVASRTLAGQELDLNRLIDQRNFDYQQGRDQRANMESDRNYGLTLAQLTGRLPDGTPTTAEQQRQLENLWIVAQQTGTIPNEIADLYGIPRGTRTLDAQNMVFNQNLQLQELALSRQREARIASGGGSSSSGGTSNKEYTGGVVSNFEMPRTAATMETYIINNMPGGDKVQGPPPPNVQEWIENQILSNPNLSENDMVKLYNRFGIPLPQ